MRGDVYELIFFFSTKTDTYVVGTQKNRLLDGSFEHPKLIFRPKINIILGQFGYTIFYIFTYVYLFIYSLIQLCCLNPYTYHNTAWSYWVMLDNCKIFILFESNLV